MAFNSQAFRIAIKLKMNMTGCNQTDVARVAGITVPTVHAILHGKHDPSINSYFALLKWLGLEHSDFEDGR